MKKDPVRLYGYSILPLMIKKEYKVLGAWTVMQKSVLRWKVPLAGTKQYFFLFQEIEHKFWPNISIHL